MNYHIAEQWLDNTGLVSGFSIRTGIYSEQTDTTERRVCIVPTGGNMPSDVNNEVRVSFIFISGQNDGQEFESIVNSVIEESRCNYSFNGYTVQAMTPLSRPMVTEGKRTVYEIGFRIL